MKSFKKWLDDKNRIDEQEITQPTPDVVNSIAKSIGGQIGRIPDALGGSAGWWAQVLTLLGNANKNVRTGVTQANTTASQNQTQNTQNQQPSAIPTMPAASPR